MKQALIFVATFLLGTPLAAGPAAAQPPITDPNVFCTGDPCVIDQDFLNIPTGSNVDFGSRHVILQATLDVGNGSFELRAGRLTIEGLGEFRAKGGLGEDGGWLDIIVSGDIEVNGELASGAFFMNGQSGGSLLLVSQNGSITGSGRIRASANVSLGDGGGVLLRAGQDIVLSGSIEITGGLQGSGGDGDFDAGGDINLSDLDFHGGDFGGGWVDMTAGDSVTLGNADLRGSNGGDGGDLDVVAGGSIEMLGELLIKGSSMLEGGDGGSLFFSADQGRIHLAPNGSIVLTGGFGGGSLDFYAPVILLEGPIEADATSYGGLVWMEGYDNITLTGSVDVSGGIDGGSLEFYAPVILVEGPIDVEGTESAGDVFILAADDLTLNGPILAEGGDGGGAWIDLLSDGTIQILSDVNGNSMGAGFNTGLVRIKAEGPVQIGLTATVSADGLSGGDGGDVLLRGCAVSVSAGASLSAQGLDGEIRIEDSDQMTLAGNFQAGPGGAAAIELRHRNLAQVPITTGATLNIAPTIIHDPALPPCTPCGNMVIENGEECDDGNNDSCDGCSATCKTEGTCGDGDLDPVCEECDDGNNIDGDGCSASCLAEPLDKAQQKCVNSINKGAAKVAKAQGGNNSACIKSGGKGKLTGTIEQCIVPGPKGKVQKAIAKIKVGDCPLPPPWPAIDTNATSIGDKMITKELDLIHAIFGTDLDESIVLAVNDKNGAGCQSALAKAVQKCQDTKLEVFNACKKNRLKGKNTSQAAGAGELEDKCLGTGSNGIPDGKGKIANRCVTKINGAISKKCGTSDTDALFPGCAGEPLQPCLDQKVECAVCKALNALDGLARDCDEFDDGALNESCP
jgi:cysteine-rich repeat protein